MATEGGSRGEEEPARGRGEEVSSPDSAALVLDIVGDWCAAEHLSIATERRLRDMIVVAGRRKGDLTPSEV